MAFLNKKTPPAIVLKILFVCCFISRHYPFPSYSITGTLFETAFLFHACIQITLRPGMIQISGCAFLIGAAPLFSIAFPTPPLPGKSYARSVSDNNGFSMPDNFWWINVPGNTRAFSEYESLHFLFSTAVCRLLPALPHFFVNRNPTFIFFVFPFRTPFFICTSRSSLYSTMFILYRYNQCLL